MLLVGVPCLPHVIGCTSHHYSESLVLNLLRIGGKESFQLESIDDDTLPRAVSELIVKHRSKSAPLIPKSVFR